jgi:hypothetical protein
LALTAAGVHCRVLRGADTAEPDRPPAQTVVWLATDDAGSGAASRAALDADTLAGSAPLRIVVHIDAAAEVSRSIALEREAVLGAITAKGGRSAVCIAAAQGPPLRLVESIRTHPLIEIGARLVENSLYEARDSISAPRP